MAYSISEMAAQARARGAYPLKPRDWSGRAIIATKMTKEQFEAMGISKQIAPGSRWDFRDGTVYGPKPEKGRA